MLYEHKRLNITSKKLYIFIYFANSIPGAAISLGMRMGLRSVRDKMGYCLLFSGISARNLGQSPTGSIGTRIHKHKHTLRRHHCWLPFGRRVHHLRWPKYITYTFIIYKFTTMKRKLDRLNCHSMSLIQSTNG